MANRIPVKEGDRVGQVWQHSRSKKWWIDFFSDGKRIRHSLGETEPDQAIEKARRILAKNGQPSVQSIRRITVGDAVKKYLTEWSPEVHKPITQRRYRQVLEELVNRVGRRLRFSIPITATHGFDRKKWK